MTKLKREVHIFWTALMFYTRLPVPKISNYQEDYLNKATRYFPLIGWIVGSIAAGVVYGSFYIFPEEITIILSMVVSVLITGAFHEDGFADVCDGFGGGWSKSKILEIMKDSRVGTFAVIGLLMIFLLKFFALLTLLNRDIWLVMKVLVFAHVVSRFFALTFVLTTPYSREDALSKIKPIAKSLRGLDVSIALLFTLPTFLFFVEVKMLFLIATLLILKIYLRHFFVKWIGGYTGDCLGAAQQISEVVVYLFVLAMQ
jgi:adenosylcobinamide-GDP ribazoletransferase